MNKRKIGILWVMAPFLIPFLACAEVMDKEMSVLQVWDGLLWALLICVLTAGVWRWLLVPSFLCGLGTGLAFAWTEWFNPYVGPAIRNEAGPGYGYHINLAVSLLLLAHIAAWFLSSRFSIVSRRRTPPNPAIQQGRKRALFFASALAALTALAASGGFGATARIWISPPVLVAAVFVGWAAFAYGRTVRKKSKSV
jgi:hypothetical protein